VAWCILKDHKLSSRVECKYSLQNLFQACVWWWWWCRRHRSAWACGCVCVCMCKTLWTVTFQLLMLNKQESLVDDIGVR
jgi:hypothetical protein